MKRLALITLAALAAVAGTALATGGDREHPPTLAQGADVATAIEPAAREAAAILAAPRTSADVIPDHLAGPLARRAAFGSNPDLSRLAIAQASQSLYLVPGIDHVCFILTHTARGGWAITCAPTQDLAAGRAAPMTNGFADGSLALAGIVPDGVEQIRVDDGAADPIPVANNAYYRVFGADEIPATIAYDGPSGPVTWDVPNPHDLPPPGDGQE